MCSDGDVRLVGKETGREEQVEMCYNGVWGTVCADGWDEIAANITYSQVGFRNCNNDSEFIAIASMFCALPLSVCLSIPFKGIESGNSPTLFNNITCNENHSMLLQCIDVHSIGVYDCNESNIARVVCKMPNPGVTTSTLAKTSVSI